MKILVLFLSLFVSSTAFAQFGADAGTIRNIELKTDQRGFIINIVGEGKLEPNTIVIDNPPRIALDFPNVRNLLYPKVLVAEQNAYVHRVRTSLYAKGRQTISRITVDLKGRLDYGLYNNENGVTLAISPATAKTESKTPEKKPVTAASQQRTVETASSSGGNGVSTQTVIPPAARPATQDPLNSVVPSQLSVPPADIVIGSEDLLEISVFELPQFSTTARVQGDGSITMPLIGSIEVRGLKKKEVEAKIAAALQAKYVNDANVSVNVKEYKSRQVSLLGEVKQPGAYYVMSHRTLLQLLSEAGGLTPAAGPKCYVFRPGAPKIEINLRDLMVNGNPALNIAIYPGDVVNIPPETKLTVYVLGAVRQPGAVQLSTSMPVTLLAAVAAAGGPSDSAKESDIRIKRRGSGGEENLIKANLKDIMKGKVEDIPLFEGDIITVPESFF